MQVDVHPPYIIHDAHEPDPLGVRLACQPPRSPDQVRQPVGLGAQRVCPGIAHFAHHDHRALEIPLGLLQDQDVVVRLERHFGRAGRGDSDSRRADITAERVAVQQIRGVHRDSYRGRELTLASLLRQPRDLGLLEIGADLGPPRQHDEITQRHPLPPRIHPRLRDHPRYRHEILTAQRQHGVDHDGVPILQPEGRDNHAGGRILTGTHRSLVPSHGPQRYINHRPGRRPRSTLWSRQQPMHRDASQLGVGPEPARRLNQIGERLIRLQLVHVRPHHRALDLGARAVHRHEHHVPRLEPQVGARIAVDEIVVQVERGDRLATAAQLHLPHVRPLGHAARRVQRRQHRAERAELIGPRLAHLAHHVRLIGPHVSHRDVELGGGVGVALHPRIHAAEPRVQHVAQLVERQVRDEHLADLRDENEPLARD